MVAVTAWAAACQINTCLLFADWLVVWRGGLGRLARLVYWPDVSLNKWLQQCRGLAQPGLGCSQQPIQTQPRPGPPPVLQPHAARRIAAPRPASKHGHPHPATPGMDRVTLNTTVKFLSVERNTTTILHYYILHSLFIATKIFSPDI